VTYISNESCLTEIRDATAPDLSLDQLYARIQEVYQVDVRGLDVLIDFFARIESGELYQRWRSAQNEGKGVWGQRVRLRS
jgi:hypothetical protein